MNFFDSGRSLRRAFFILVLACRLLPCLAAQQLPRPSGFVNDFAGVMKAQDVRAVESLAAVVKEKTGAELAVVTIKSFAPYASIDAFSFALAEAWGVGERGKDNGVLLVLAMKEREVRIEVGYGLEGAIPDSVAGRIIDTAVIPAFRRNDFSGGLAEGCRVIAAYVAKEKGVSLEGFDLPKTGETGGSFNDFGIVFLFFIIFGLMFVISPVFFVLRIMRAIGRGGYSAGSFGSGRSFGSSGRSFSSSGSSFSSSRSFGGGSFGGGGSSRRF